MISIETIAFVQFQGAVEAEVVILEGGGHAHLLTTTHPHVPQWRQGLENGFVLNQHDGLLGSSTNGFPDSPHPLRRLRVLTHYRPTRPAPAEVQGMQGLAHCLWAKVLFQYQAGKAHQLMWMPYRFGECIGCSDGLSVSLLPSAFLPLTFCQALS